MTLIFRFSLIYMFSAFLIWALCFQDTGMLVVNIVLAFKQLSAMLMQNWIYGLPFVILGFWFCRSGQRREIVIELIGVLMAVIVLQIGFNFIKLSSPVIIPFYADQILAEVDRWLCGGVDAWRIAHALIPDYFGAHITTFYFLIWGPFAFGLPLLIVMTDRDPARRVRYMVLYFGAWVVLGNIAATLMNSVGPVYFDRLMGGHEFAGLALALDDSGVSASLLGRIQDMLWTRYETGTLAFGQGISAFPSMHIAMATVTMLYFAERWKCVALLAWGFLTMIFVLSVYTGFHYVSDGLFSFAAVLLGNWALKRRMAPAEDATLLRAIAA